MKVHTLFIVMLLMFCSLMTVFSLAVAETCGDFRYKLDPNGNALRAEVAAMFMRYINYIAELQQ